MGALTPTADLRDLGAGVDLPVSQYLHDKLTVDHAVNSILGAAHSCFELGSF